MTQDETTIITGALDMTQKTAKDAMTPLPKIFSLDINSKLDEYVLIAFLQRFPLRKILASYQLIYN